MLIIDFHLHPFLFDISEEIILKEIERAKVSHAVLLTPDYEVGDYDIPDVKKKIKDLTNFTGWTADRVIYFLKRMAIERERQKREERVLKMISNFPEKFTWFGSVNPNRSEEKIYEKLKQLKKWNVKGLKFLPTFQIFDPSKCDNFRVICEYCEKNDWIILMHTGCDPGPFEIPEIAKFANPTNLIPILNEFDLKIVLAHIGSYSAFHMGIWMKEALEILYKYDNAYGDTSAVNWFIFSGKNLVDKIRNVIDKILFGSDFPAVGGSNIEREVLIVKESPYLTEDEKLKILGLNAAKLLNLVF